MADKKSAQPSTPESVKETIESILIAFILAFVFRAFVVEAFVIPTGSMAPTLLGAHMRFRCQDCGYQFDVNFSKHGGNRDDQDIPKLTGGTTESNPPASYSMHCPNCGLKVDKENATNSPVYYGDRILVLKYLYLLQPPQRWDVVVFKSPDNNPMLPKDDWYSVNYIKRLVGRPGETIMVLDGDAFISNDDGKTWQVPTKPRAVQDSLWRVVHDVDYAPHRKDAPRPWFADPGSGWSPSAENQKVWQFAGDSGTLLFNSAARKDWFPFSDWLPYDETMSQDGQHYESEAYLGTYLRSRIPRWNVNDIKVSCFYERTDGDGPLRITLTSRKHVFTAQIDHDHASLWYRDPDAPANTLGKQIGADVPIVRSNSPLQIDLMHVDYQATLRINGEDVAQTTRDQYHPDVQKLLAEYQPSPNRQASGQPSVSISAQKQACKISHLSLWRDIYYTPEGEGGRPLVSGSPGNPVHLASRAKGAPEDEYFVMGDNSILSADARYWDQPVNLRESENLVADYGRVPGRFMIGKAFFVYWPAGFRPISKEAPGLIPNFGDMRFIH